MTRFTCQLSRFPIWWAGKTSVDRPGAQIIFGKKRGTPRGPFSGGMVACAMSRARMLSPTWTLLASLAQPLLPKGSKVWPSSSLIGCPSLPIGPKREKTPLTVLQFRITSGAHLLAHRQQRSMPGRGYAIAGLAALWLRGSVCSQGLPQSSPTGRAQPHLKQGQPPRNRFERCASVSGWLAGVKG